MKKEKDSGLKEGELIGRHSQNIENAKKMLEKGIDINTIIEITGVSEKEIKDALK